MRTKAKGWLKVWPYGKCAKTNFGLEKRPRARFKHLGPRLGLAPNLFILIF